MTKHDFSDLTPPLDLVQEQWLTERPSIEAQRIATFFSRWGAQQAAERLKGQWPTPISRPPTRADADRDGFIQRFDRWGHWVAMGIETALINPPKAWHHTPRWQPPATPTLKEQAIEAFKRRYPKRQYFDDGTGNAVEVNAELFADLDLIRRALEADS